MLFPPRHVRFQDLRRVAGSLRDSELLRSPLTAALSYTTPGPIRGGRHRSAVFKQKSPTEERGRRDEEANSSLLLDGDITADQQYGGKPLLDAIHTPRWELQQASLEENETIASLKVCKRENIKRCHINSLQFERSENSVMWILCSVLHTTTYHR